MWLFATLAAPPAMQLQFSATMRVSQTDQGPGGGPGDGAPFLTASSLFRFSSSCCAWAPPCANTRERSAAPSPRLVGRDSLSSGPPPERLVGRERYCKF